MNKHTQEAHSPVPHVAYRLRSCPSLRDEHRSARILGALARMELGPVSSSWFATRTGLRPHAAVALLEDICAQGCAQRIVIRPPEAVARRGMLLTAYDRLRQAIQRERSWEQTRAHFEDDPDGLRLQVR
jgi:hypothetical protein